MRHGGRGRVYGARSWMGSEWPLQVRAGLLRRGKWAIVSMLFLDAACDAKAVPGAMETEKAPWAEWLAVVV